MALAVEGGSFGWCCGWMDGDGGAVPMWMGLWQVQLKAQWWRDGELVGASVGPIASVGSCACCGCCGLTSQSMLVDTIEMNQVEANQVL